jgi:CRISPR-associated exonuclease Cas4
MIDPAIVLVIGSIILVFGVLLLFVVARGKQQMGSLSGTVLYMDHGETRGDILYAKQYHLMGRPDFLIRKGNDIMPVEVKTGKTPARPHDNHIMQLMAYCLLVEENFGVVPPGGYIRYPDREFGVKYTAERREAVLSSLREIIALRKGGAEPQCDHPYHNLKV